MFNKGDKVVYPHHGAGIIDAIKEQNIFSEKKKYYILKLSMGQLVINVPVTNSQELGLRSVISKNKASQVLKVLTDKKKSKKINDCVERFRINSEKLATGDTFIVAEVVRDLTEVDKLSTREKRLLSKARDILISELMHSLGKTKEEMIKRVDKILK